jgi:hypothetical protein
MVAAKLPNMLWIYRHCCLYWRSTKKDLSTAKDYVEFRFSIYLLKNRNKCRFLRGLSLSHARTRMLTPRKNINFRSLDGRPDVEFLPYTILQAGKRQIAASRRVFFILIYYYYYNKWACNLPRIKSDDATKFHVSRNPLQFCSKWQF